MAGAERRFKPPESGRKRQKAHGEKPGGRAHRRTRQPVVDPLGWDEFARASGFSQFSAGRWDLAVWVAVP